MILYIVRHAYAGEHGDPRYPDDSLRPVTRKGNRRFDRLVRRLVRAGMSPAAIGTSPYRRCAQTARILAKRLASDVKPQPVASFTPGCHWQEVVGWVASQNGEDLAMVGHGPDVDYIAGALVGADGAALHFAKGAVCAIRFTEEIAAGRGVVQWLATPALFR